MASTTIVDMASRAMAEGKKKGWIRKKPGNKGKSIAKEEKTSKLKGMYGHPSSNRMKD